MNQIELNRQFVDNNLSRIISRNKSSDSSIDANISPMKVTKETISM